MLKDILDYDGIYLAWGTTDLRRSVDRLASIVKQEFKMDPFGNHLSSSVTGAAIGLKP